MLSPQTVHAPTPRDTYRERSASSAAQIVNLGAAEALGGPILNKVLSKVSGRSAASAERAALRAEQERLVRVLHKREFLIQPQKAFEQPKAKLVIDSKPNSDAA